MTHRTSRRFFLRESLLVTTGVCAGICVPEFLKNQFVSIANADDGKSPAGFEQRLRDLNIELPPQGAPVAVYVPAVVTGDLLFSAGHIPRTMDGELVTGRIGDDLTLEEGYDAARLVGLHLLSTVRGTLGSLDRVVKLVKVLGMVNCTSEFTQQSQVVNGFSELMVEVLGEQSGKAGRSAVGMGSLPLNVPVEIEAVFEIVPDR
ncbi:MAG: RidA family protein [Planctomycetaceae bacterium]|nr:RidA family protein [Planctomycetaceae bacterium]